MPAPLPSLPGFRLHSYIGSGPSGHVFHAHDEQRGRDVAVKLLDPRRCSPRGLARLSEAAARAAASPVARDDALYEVVARPGQPIVVMDLLPGESLQRMLLRTGPMAWKKARAIAHAVAVALEAAHDVGAVHGAVKSTNIFLAGNLVILTDFGIRSLAEPRDREALLADAAHLAPEQLRGEPPDPRTDLYGLGLVLYELVTGRLPFVGRAHEVFQAQLRRPPPAPSSLVSSLPPAADALLLELLAKPPERRPPTASRLRGLLSGSGRRPDHEPSMADRMSWRRPPDTIPPPVPAARDREPSIAHRVSPRPPDTPPPPVPAALDRAPRSPLSPAAPDGAPAASSSPPSVAAPPAASAPVDPAAPSGPQTVPGTLLLALAALAFVLLAGLPRSCL